MMKTNRRTGRQPRRRVGHLNLPAYCDFSCPYASFASPDAVGACRRDQAVYCSLLDAYNMKNAICIMRKAGGLKR